MKIIRYYACAYNIFNTIIILINYYYDDIGFSTVVRCLRYQVGLGACMHTLENLTLRDCFFMHEDAVLRHFWSIVHHPNGMYVLGSSNNPEHICIINSMAIYKCAIWVIIPGVTGSEACNCTRRYRVLLQASEQSRVVLSPKIVHLDTLLIAKSIIAQLTVIICHGWS